MEFSTETDEHKLDHEDYKAIFGYMPPDRPPSYLCYVEPTYYKVGAHDLVYKWWSGAWVRSAKSLEILQADVLEEIFKNPKKRVTGAEYLRRIESRLIINEHKAVVNKYFYKLTTSVSAEKMGKYRNCVLELIREAERKLSYTK